MSQVINRARVILTTIPCLFLVACDEWGLESSERYQSDFHYSYALNPGGRLEIENFTGSIEITGWDQPRCDISGSKYASTADMRDRIKIDVNQSGTVVYARSVRPTGDFHGNMGVRYVIHVPRKTELSRISSSNGSIHVEDTEGRAELNTTNGSVRVDSLAGMLMAHTSNGSIAAENVSGAMGLRTSNGTIRADHVMAGIEATTSNGAITVNFDEKAPVSTTPLKFETNNGKIDITLPTSPKSDLRAHTSNSNITLRLPENASAKVSMETSHGHVQSDFESGETHAEKHGRRQNLEETIGSGGPFIDLHTTNGSIRLLKM
jgi:hypothetical protein